MSQIAKIQEIIQKERFTQNNLLQKGYRYKERILGMSKWCICLEYEFIIYF